MAARSLAFVSAFIVLSFYNGALSEDVTFPTKEELDFPYYTTEVQITDVLQETAAYATEYFDNIFDKGVVKIYFQGDLQSIYYDNFTSEITEVIGSNCTSTIINAEDSKYYYNPIYYGWLNKDPLVIGPSATLWYALANRNSVQYAGEEDVRDIVCDKFILPVASKAENLTYEYYFNLAGNKWTSPYKYKNLRTPLRVRITGTSSRYSGNGVKAPVNMIYDFAYFKPSIDDFNNFLPPVGLGCQFKQATNTSMPPIPSVFQYSAEVVDLLAAKEHEDIEIQFQKTWYDHTRLLARKDKYSRKDGYKSILYDFNTGTTYRILDDGTCQMDGIISVEFLQLDYSMTYRMMTPAEALNLNGKFYEMGKREVRGLKCDTYERVGFNEHFGGKLYYKLVITAYFTEDKTKVGVNGNPESRIPIFYYITGYSSPSNKTLQLQYNIFEFNDVIWPEMYSSFRLDRCFTKANKAYFVLVMDVPAKVAALLESQDQIVKVSLRSSIAKHAKVPEMRIPFLKIDYKSTGVFTTGVILDRPPALLQFEYIDTASVVTHDPDLKVIPDAENLEQCAYSCIGEDDFPCKGFYFCGRACFLKSIDPLQPGDGETTDLGVCALYIREEIESTNFRQSYLNDALGNLETAVLNGSVSVRFPIPSGTEIVQVQDIVIGDGPYTGVDAGDKPFDVSIQLRKLDKRVQTTRTVEYVGSIHDCYKKCKEAGSLCSSFSYCPDSVKDDKECLISSTLIIDGVTKDTELIPDKYCNIYNLKFSDYFIPYPEKMSLLSGDKSIRNVPSTEKCAESCRLEKDFKCRGFEYCRSEKVCTLHTKHILDLKAGETAGSNKQCTHYAARYIADYMDLGGVLIEDDSNVRYGTSLEDCAKICSEDLAKDCNSFNYCPSVDFTDSSCALSTKLLRDSGTTTVEKRQCAHYEKRDVVHDWDNSKASGLSRDGYTAKGFAGLVVGMLILGLIVGALGFILYSYRRSKSTGEGMAVRFMKNDS